VSREEATQDGLLRLMAGLDAGEMRREAVGTTNGSERGTLQ